ncbi:MAG: hypothetical protein B7Z60_06485 [Ferrovum sp. 37-45-19]|uniref:hypothetical protein n=1 Tax=Ferrovum sp. JA12 TaxID=1356299 RepID=UPI0007039585|nr:hypothetical protein [Ferrovum sp. JA12]OYV79958.1 MAG: hypothetical protein B7Z65_04425 [Ferrovum sp. 21-44-67]OYV94091.1 MAG: hypothetical protein B7Z60_06485 [Ferrovum sp. 37-45-19]OZB33981.1 MAG: hypothetical protein B7X47_02435 [Ferrovum sp. 34-44-207]HQT82087.1 hypothetical protein [Ferrovaceae bacterium]KRH78272.1 hypothetical protein FERRO_12530 [Ferrovum sp. JA12]
MITQSLRISGLVLAFLAMSFGALMAHADNFDAKQRAIQDEYNEIKPLTGDGAVPHNINHVYTALYNQSIQDVILESKQLSLLQSVYQRDVVHLNQDQRTLDLGRIEEQKRRLLQAQHRAYTYAVALSRHNDTVRLLSN